MIHILLFFRVVTQILQAAPGSMRQQEPANTQHGAGKAQGDQPPDKRRDFAQIGKDPIGTQHHDNANKRQQHQYIHIAAIFDLFHKITPLFSIH